MKSHLELIPTKGMDKASWLAYRKSGVGASEVGSILGLSPYKSSIELFYEKIGEGVGYNVENIFMFMGLEQENFIADMWQYWGGSEESMMANFREEKIIRKCARVNAYVRNPKYPWLFVSLDRRIIKTPTQGEGALEIKTISGYESEKWAAGIPPSHVVQVQTQCLVCEFEFGELATLKDGRRFDVIPFEYSQSLSEGIIERTKEFWDKVELGKKLVTQEFEARRTFNIRLAEDIAAQLHDLEPPPDGSDAYLDYMKEKYHLAQPGEISGTEAEIQLAREHKEIKGQIKDLEEEARLRQNKLIYFLNGMDRITFGVEGYVSWKQNSNGSRVFLNKVK